jgi:DNA-binding NarL/FixJ family response regulator
LTVVACRYGARFAEDDFIMTATPIRILVADDNAFYRKTICGIIQNETNLQVVAEAEGGLAAIQAVKEHRPDVVLMDINMPVPDGLDATRIIATMFPDTKVIVLTMHTDGCFSDRAYKAGARHFLGKDCGKEKLLSAIKHCSPGQ